MYNNAFCIGINLLFVPVERIEQTKRMLLNLNINNLQVSVSSYDICCSGRKYNSDKIECILIPINPRYCFEYVSSVAEYVNSVAYDIASHSVGSPQIISFANSIFVSTLNLLDSYSYVVIKHRHFITKQTSLLILNKEFQIETI